MSVTETDLLESREVRDRVMDRVHVLEKVKALSLLPDDMHVTTQMVAGYFEVGEANIRQIAHRHRSELMSNGMRNLKGADLREFESDNLSLSTATGQARRSLMVYPRRAVLNIAMLLRDSKVARQVRSYLLDVEETSRPQPSDHPVDNSGSADAETLARLAAGLKHFVTQTVDQRLDHLLDERIDEALDRRLGEALDGRIERVVDARLAQFTEERIVAVTENAVRQVIGTAVTPLLNHLIQTSGEHRQELVAIRNDVERIDRTLAEHDLRLRKCEREGVMAAMDAMTWREFERHIAALCERDGCTDLAITSTNSDLSADIVGLTADGRGLVVQCKSFAPFRPVQSGDMQKFIGMARLEYRADVAIFVTTSTFTQAATDLAARHGVTAVHRGLLEAWSSGVKLQALR
jgi:HJR/Mrr/RecB family endonuclease